MRSTRNSPKYLGRTTKVEHVADIMESLHKKLHKANAHGSTFEIQLAHERKYFFENRGNSGRVFDKEQQSMYFGA